MEKLRIKALRVIEGLCFPDISTSPEKKIDDIYKFSHIALGQCENKHEDWHKELDRAEEALIKHGIMSKNPKS